MIIIQLTTTEDHYPTMVQWATQRSFPLPPLSFLPTNTMVALDKDLNPLYSICVYHTDSEVMWIGWELSDPNAESSYKGRAAERLLKHIEEYAKKNGYKHILTTSATPPVEKLLHGSGFIKADQNINQYIKNI